MIVGDFNIAHKDIDVHSRWKVEECYTSGKYLDSFFLTLLSFPLRELHRTVNLLINSLKTTNNGVRIPYIVNYTT